MTYLLLTGAVAALGAGCDGGLPQGDERSDGGDPPADVELDGSYALVLDGLGATEGEARGQFDHANGSLRTLRPAHQLAEVGGVLVQIWVSTPSLTPGRYPIAHTDGEVLPNGCRTRTEAARGEATLVLALSRDGERSCYPVTAVGEVEILSAAAGDVRVRFAFRAAAGGPEGVPAAVVGRGTFSLRTPPGRSRK